MVPDQLKTRARRGIEEIVNIGDLAIVTELIKDWSTEAGQMTFGILN